MFAVLCKDLSKGWQNEYSKVEMSLHLVIDTFPSSFDFSVDNKIQ
jgi:hypothetical protein